MSVHRDVAALLRRHGSRNVLDAMADGAEACGTHLADRFPSHGARRFAALSHALRQASSDAVRAEPGLVNLADGIEVFADVEGV